MLDTWRQRGKKTFQERKWKLREGSTESQFWWPYEFTQGWSQTRGKTWDPECLYNLRGARMPLTASEICRVMLPQESGGPSKCCLCITCPLQDRRKRSKRAGRIRHLPSRKSWCCLPGLVSGLPEPVQAPAGCSLSDLLRERKVPQELQERKTQHRVLSGRIYGSSTLHPLLS